MNKRLLSALLAIVMILSLLVVPTAAVEGEVIPAGSYDFKDNSGASGTTPATPAGITWGGFAYGNAPSHGPQSNGATTLAINTSADKFTTLTVTTCQFGQVGRGQKDPATVTVGGAAADVAVNAVAGADPVYTIYNAKGEVALAFNGYDYIHGVDVVENETETTLYTVDVDSAITGGKVTVNPSGKVPAGTEITVTATADDGYELVADSVKVGEDAISGGTFTVSADSTVTAQFAAKTEPEVELDKTAVEVEGDSTVTVAATMKNDGGKTVTWTATSSAESVATVAVATDGTVTVTGVAAGTATITVKGTLADSAGEAQATFEVEVWKDPTSWDFTKQGIQDQFTANNGAEFTWRGVTFKGAKAGGADNGAAFFSDAAEGDALDKAGSIQIPVSGPSKITVVPSYHWDVQLGTDATTRKTKDTDATSPLEFTYMGKAGMAVLNMLNRNDGGEKRTWIKSISVEALEMCDVTAGCTLLKGHTGECVVAQPWDGAKIDFQSLTKEQVQAVMGVTIADTFTVRSDHGMNTSAATAVTMKLSAAANVTVQGCRFGTSLTGATATGADGAIAMPVAWDKGGDPEYLFENVPAGDFTLTLPSGAWVHSIAADYSTEAKTPQLWVTEDCASAEVGKGNATVSVLTRFAGANKPTLTQDTGTDKATITISEDGTTITVAPLAEGEATATVSLTGAAASQSFTALVWGENKVHTEWKLKSGKWTTKEKVDIQSKTGTLRGLEIDATAGKFAGSSLGANWVQFNTGAIVKVPVNVPDGQVAKVTVGSYEADTITVDGVANKDAEGNNVTEFNCAGTGGYVTIVAAKKSGSNKEPYLGDIKVEYVEGETKSVLELDKESVELKMVKKPTDTVTPTIYGSKTELEITSSNSEVATAVLNAETKKIDVTAVGVGTATITVKIKDATEAEATKTFTVTVAENVIEYIAPGDYNFQESAGQYTPANIESLKGLDTHGAVPQVQSGSGHGLQDPDAGAGTSGGATGTVQLTVYIPETQKARLTFEICGYGAGQQVTVASDKSADTVTHTNLTTAHGDGGSKAVVETTGTVTVSFTSTNPDNKGIWIHSMGVAFLVDNTPDPVADRRIHVWDIAGKAEADTSLYTNHITPATWAAYAATLTGENATLAAAGEFPGQTIDLDGLLINTAAKSSFQCSLFSTVTGEWGTITPKTGSLVNDFGDGYTSAGGYMAYGAGGASRRFITITGVRKGESVVAYVGNNQKATTFGVDGVPEASVTTASKEYGKLSFIAPDAGNYKIYEPANAGKPAYLRVVVIPPVQVSGSITLPQDFDAAEGWGVKFTDTETKAVTEATLTKTGDAWSYVAELAPDHTYNAALTNARGWGMTSATKSVAPAKTDITAVKTQNLVVEKKEVYDYSGSIQGFADGYDLSQLKITMVPDELSAADGVEAEELAIDKTAKTFTVTLQPGVEYTLKMEGVEDYAITTPEKVSSDSGDLTAQTITVATKDLMAASGKFVVLDVDDQFAPLYPDSTYEALSATVTDLKFVFVEKNELGKETETKYVYPATVANGGYTVSLRPGSYLAKATVNGYATKTHVVVDGKGAVSKDLLFVSTATPAAVAYAADIYVGDASKGELNFKTITGAMAYIKRMTRTDAQRVTVHIAPGTYREQISIDSKNVTFVNADPSKEVKLTWYYGIGYKYYSATGPSNLERWYDAQSAFDRYEKNDGTTEDVARWGATVRIQAPGFQAQDITFENSLNRYLTDEEIYDGVDNQPLKGAPGSASDTGITFVRDYGADVTSKAATERGAAIWTDTNNNRGDMSEFKNCKLLSSQDTLGTGKRMYFKDCYIEGMTDFICGPGDVVFDTCTLNWKGYSEKEAAGYLTAPQSGAAEKGYLFRNCYVSADTKLKVVPGQMGRTWGKENTGCIFYNTTLQNDKIIGNDTWADMNGFKAENATKIKEWGTKLADGTVVDLSKRTLQNTVATTEPEFDVKADYFKDWVPEYYVEETAQSVALDGVPTVTDNGDINLPKPGHTLTVSYTLTPADADANDASTIQWYAVKDGTEKLVKTATCADRTYQIQTADVGAKIKVTVTPKTMGGLVGEPGSYTVAETVKEGYDDPSSTIDPSLGDGVNIFLAGDSTVKDYSPSGMYMGGKNQGEGSWGEFLQNYFGEGVTVVNYANGGRSTRNFINEGSLDKIAGNIKEGDYLFIQFAHNDSSNGDPGHLTGRYVPLGTPNASGVYPSTPGTKGGDGQYAWDCGGTYKWFLQQYIDVAKSKGAIPVLVTPVARMYYNADGTIKPHHDETKIVGEGSDCTKWENNTNKSNAYCTAVRQLAEEQDVLLIDGYALTEKMFVDAYKAGGNDTYGKQTMHWGDSTHSNKLGGMMEAALMAQAIQNMDLNISKAVKAPAKVSAKHPAYTDPTSVAVPEKTAFTVDGQGKLTAYDMLKNYEETAPYWMGEGQKLFDAIAEKAEELNKGDQPGPKPPVVDPTDPAEALKQAIAAAEKLAKDTKVSTDGADVAKRDNWVTQDVMDAFKAAIEKAQAVADKADATEAELTKATEDLAAAVKALEDASQPGTKKVSYGGGTSGTIADAKDKADKPEETKPTFKADKTTDKDGNTEIVVKDNAGEVMADVKIPAQIPSSDVKFDDAIGHWAEDSIDNMAALGVVNGVGGNTYGVEDDVTRGALATMLFRFANGKEGIANTFADVAANTWYTDAIGWAVKTGVVTGYSAEEFGPNDQITREQLAVMLARFAKLVGLDTAGSSGDLAGFKDVSSVSSWAVDGMAWCVKNGIIKGVSADTLSPDTNATRAQTAVMLDRFIALMK